MGFIQNNTADVLVDVVLTEAGRKALANNSNSRTNGFSVVKWAASDDEVDYRLIQRFGRTNGMEKIEKNTPIFEALTNQLFAQKHKLISLSDPDKYRMPTVTIQGEDVDSGSRIVSIGDTTKRKKRVTVFQDIQNETSIDQELRDMAFVVNMDDKFIQIVGAVKDNIDTYRRATYILPKDDGETSLGGSRLTFTIGTKNITTEQFNIYGARNNKNLIRTYVKVTGTQSGSTLEFEVDITKGQ